MSFFEKAILLYLCMAIACSFWQPTIIFGDDNPTNVLTTMFNINTTNITGNNFNLTFGNSQLQENVNPNDETNQSTLFKIGKDFTSAFQWVADGLGNVLSVVGIVFKVLFSPFIMFIHMIGLGAPSPILFIFAIPLIVMMFVGIIFFIRSGF